METVAVSSVSEFTLMSQVLSIRTVRAVHFGSENVHTPRNTGLCHTSAGRTNAPSSSASEPELRKDARCSANRHGPLPSISWRLSSGARPACICTANWSLLRSQRVISLIVSARRLNRTGPLTPLQLRSIKPTSTDRKLFCRRKATTSYAIRVSWSE